MTLFIQRVALAEVLESQFAHFPISVSACLAT
jgi:hypothetical protein